MEMRQSTRGAKQKSRLRLSEALQFDFDGLADSTKKIRRPFVHLLKLSWIVDQWRRWVRLRVKKRFFLVARFMRYYDHGIFVA